MTVSSGSLDSTPLAGILLHGLSQLVVPEWNRRVNFP
jgi:hypothetical protein